MGSVKIQASRSEDLCDGPSLRPCAVSRSVGCAPPRCCRTAPVPFLHTVAALPSGRRNRGLDRRCWLPAAVLVDLLLDAVTLNRRGDESGGTPSGTPCARLFEPNGESCSSGDGLLGEKASPGAEDRASGRVLKAAAGGPFTSRRFDLLLPPARVRADTGPRRRAPRLAADGAGLFRPPDYATCPEIRACIFRGRGCHRGAGVDAASIFSTGPLSRWAALRCSMTEPTLMRATKSAERPSTSPSAWPLSASRLTVSEERSGLGYGIAEDEPFALDRLWGRVELTPRPDGRAQGQRGPGPCSGLSTVPGYLLLRGRRSETVVRPRHRCRWHRPPPRGGRP